MALDAHKVVHLLIDKTVERVPDGPPDEFAQVESSGPSSFNAPIGLGMTSFQYAFCLDN